MQICEACGQPIRQAHKERLSKQGLEMLKRAAGSIIDSGVNQVRKKDIDFSGLRPSAYGNFQRLRYFGLIAKVRDRQTGKVVKGYWLITRKGWGFLRGSDTIHKFVIIKNNGIDSRSDELVGIRDVLIGAPYLQTNFEYFDDDGQMVGIRPTLPHAPENARLL